MRVFIISIFFPPERGAAPSRIFNTAKELLKRGCRVEVITALANYPKGRLFPEYRRKLFCREVIEDIPCRRYWLFPSNSNNPFVRILSMFSFAVSVFFALPYLLRRRPDAVIVQSPPLLAGLAGIWLGRLAGTTVVTNVSDVWPLTALHLGAVEKGPAYSFFEGVERRMYKYSHAFMAQSQETLDHIAKFESKPSLLHRNLSPPSPYLRCGPEFRKQHIRVLYAGLLGLAQGVLEICRNIDFKELGVEFHIYGDGIQRNGIEEYLRNNPQSNVFLHDSVPANQIPEILAQHHAAVVSLANPIYGAVPSKIFMAISAGLPIIFSGGGEGERIIKELGVGWVSPPGDYEAMKRNISMLTALSVDEYGRIRSNCVVACENRFDYERQQERLVTFIRGLLV